MAVRTPMIALRELALALPDVKEGIACAGTALERRTIKTRNKAFLFVGAADAMLKLQASLAEAAKLAAKQPGRYKVGANGWVKLAFSAKEPPQLDVAKRWIAESYALMTAAKATAKKPAKQPVERGRAAPNTPRRPRSR
jgi:hypothetical protein